MNFVFTMNHEENELVTSWEEIKNWFKKMK